MATCVEIAIYAETATRTEVETCAEMDIYAEMETWAERETWAEMETCATKLEMATCWEKETSKPKIATCEEKAITRLNEMATEMVTFLEYYVRESWKSSREKWDSQQNLVSKASKETKTHYLKLRTGKRSHNEIKRYFCSARQI